MTRALVVFVLASSWLALSGCTRNAILELELELPEQPGGPPLFAVVSARSDVGFDEAWEGTPVASVPLPVSCMRASELSCGDRVPDPACAAVFSLVGDGSDLGPLHVRVRFCVDPACAAAEDASATEHRVELERAFYIGRYTQARVCLEAVPSTSNPPPELIERCAVRCREGSGAYQCRSDDTHFCE
jgi:hypothetical protein